MFTIKYTTKMKSNVTTDVLTTEAEHYESICKSTKSCYEKIDDDAPVRIYADFDYKPENVPNLDEFVYDEMKTGVLIDVAKEYLLLKFQELWPDQEEPKFAVKEQSSPEFNKDGKLTWKYSFHIIIHNFMMTKKEQLDFIKDFNADIKDDQYGGYLEADDKFTFFDQSVYKPNQKLRSPYCSKKGEHRPSKIVEGSFMETIISFKDDSIPVLHYTPKEQPVQVKPKTNSQVDFDPVCEQSLDEPISETALDEVTRLYKCFSPSRVSTHTDWIKLGQATKEVLGTCGKTLFVQFTQDHGSVNKIAECDEKYDYFKVTRSPTSLKIGTLIFWAKEDNLDLYNELFPYSDDDYKKDLKLLCSIRGEADFAKEFKKVVFNTKKILFTGEDKHLEGFIFNGVYWSFMPQHDADLHQGKFDDLHNYFDSVIYRVQNYAKNKFEIASEGNDKSETEKWEKESKRLSGLRGLFDCLQSYSKRSAIVKIFKRDSYQPKVEWNKNKNLFVFEDCVYDLVAGKFKTGSCAEEYIKTSCGYKYHIDATESEIAAAKEDLITFFKSIVEECNFEYFMTKIATFLKQTNKEEKAYFWLGNGRNGKGTATTLLRKALGKYWGELGIDYYINYEKGVDRPNQNLYDCADSRVLNTSEVQDNIKTGKGVVFIGDKFRFMTGGDPITVRELGTKNRVTYIPGHILIQTNIMPSFTKIDSAVTNRVVIMNFPYEFTDDTVKLSDPTKFKKKDESLKERFTTDVYRRALIDILFDYYKKYMEHGLIIPQSVKDYTNSYFTTQSIKSILDDFCEEKPNATVALKTLRDIYKSEKDIQISVSKIRDQLKEIGCTVTQRGLVGWALKEDELLDEP